MGILAKEQGLKDLSDVFMSIAKEELVHAGMYAELIGKIPENFFKLMPFLQQAEANADKHLGGLADMVEKLGHLEEAAAIRKTIPEELRHGAILQKMMEKYHDRLETASNSHEKHTCKICGMNIATRPHSATCRKIGNVRFAGKRNLYLHKTAKQID